MDKDTAELVIVGVSLLGSGFGMMALYSGVTAFISVLFFTSLINGLIVLGYLRSDDSDGSNDHENSRTDNSVRDLQKRFADGDLTQEEFEEKLDEVVKG